KKAEKEANNARRKAQEALFEAYLQQAKSERYSRRPGQRFKTLAAVSKAVEIGRELGVGRERMLELRNVAIGALALPDLRVAETGGNWPLESCSFDFDEGFQRYVRVELNGDITIRSVADDSEIAHLDGLGSSRTGVRLSPEGRYLAAWRTGGQLQV